jgi:predicted metalloprotease with PDZ domain
MPGFSVTHRVGLPEPKAHLVHVETCVEGALPDSLVLFMPVWTPGSYLVREYSRHVEGFAAEAPAVATKIRKNAWRLDAAGARRVVVRYVVYANELTVRTSHVDDTHAFLVGASVFVAVEGHTNVGARVEIAAPPSWPVITALPCVAERTYVAPDYDTLVDSPFSIGASYEARFEAAGKPHRFCVWPPQAIDAERAERLTQDAKRIVETEAALFGGTVPYEAYDFLLHLTPRGRGGLEHRACSALIASPQSFDKRDAYLDLLSLVAHELLHAWNVKRIRPAALVPYRYEDESYTRLLWWFEGATSYYDWRVLLVSGLCSVDEYLDHLASEIQYLDATHGRLAQSLEDASYDAWIKLYRPDENSVNSTVSYYRKGELVCALLDIELRARTAERVTLDHVLGHLWREHGLRDRPVPEDAMQSIFEHVAGVPLGDLFEPWIRRPGELGYDGTFARVGLTVDRSSRSDAPDCSLGLRLRAEGGRAMVSSVTRNTAAAAAGIDPGDELLAIAGTRVEGGNVEAALRGRHGGETVDVLLARDGRVLVRPTKLDPQRQDRVRLLVKRDAPQAARDAFTAWLGSPHALWTKASP